MSYCVAVKKMGVLKTFGNCGKVLKNSCIREIKAMISRPTVSIKNPDTVVTFVTLYMEFRSTFCLANVTKITLARNTIRLARNAIRYSQEIQ